MSAANRLGEAGRVVGLLAEVLVLVVVLAEVLVDDLARLVLPALAGQPARRLGKALSQQQGGEARDRAGREDPLPRDSGCVQQVGDDHGEQEAAVPRRLQAREPATPAPAGHHLGEHRLADRVLGADRHTQQQPEGQQLGEVGDHPLQQADDDERDQVEDEDLATAEPVGEVAEERGAEEDAGQRGGRDQALLHGREREVRDDERQHDADAAQVVAVEALPEGRGCRDPGQEALVGAARLLLRAHAIPTPPARCRSWGSSPPVYAPKPWRLLGETHTHKRKGAAAPFHSQRIAQPGACGKTPVVPENRRPEATRPRTRCEVNP